MKKKQKDKIFNYINLEKKRQENTINLIASENYASINVMKAQGSVLTNKYAEGYIKKRYYSGCYYIDKIEKIAIKRAKKIFKAKYVNVQPHSGSQANFAVFNALLKPKDIILGMKLNHGGHLTHGSKVNISGKIYNAKLYGLNNNEIINYKEISYISKKYKPKIIIAGFSSYSRFCNWKKLRKIADINNSLLMVDISHIAGLIVTKLYPNPIKYAHIVTSTTHKTLSGPRGGIILVNKYNKYIFKKINKSIFPQTQGGPLMHIIAAKAICFKEAATKKFKKYQKQILKNSKAMAKEFIKQKFKIISHGTDTHMFLINLRNKNISGKKAENKLLLANINVNKNFTLYDKTHKPTGLRIGTAAISKRGIKEKTITKITKYICNILNNINNKKLILKIKEKIKKICKYFPIYKKKNYKN